MLPRLPRRRCWLLAANRTTPDSLPILRHGAATAMSDEAPNLHTSQLPRHCPVFMSCHRRTRSEARLWSIVLNSKLSDGAKVFLCRFIQHADFHRVLELSMKQLCKATKTSLRTAHRYRNELRDGSWLSWEVCGTGGKEVVCRYKLH